MTVAANDRIAGPFVCTGGETVLPYDFPLLSAGDLRVRRLRGGGTEDLVLAVDYTVSGVGASSGGNVTLTVAAVAGDEYVVEGDRPPQRVTDLVYNRAMPPQALNPELDSLQIQIAEMKRRIDAAVTRSPFDVSDQALELPLDAGYLYLGADGGLTTQDVAGGGGGGGPPLPVSIENGGTGADDAAEARANLGLGTVAQRNLVLYGDLTPGLTTIPVTSRVINDPPAGAASGDTYIIGPVPTGAWSAWTPNVDLAVSDGAGNWTRRIPAEGWTASLLPEDKFAHFSGGVWTPLISEAAILAGARMRYMEIARQYPSATGSTAATLNAWTALTYTTLLGNTITTANGAAGTAIFTGTAGTPSANIVLPTGRRRITARQPFSPTVVSTPGHFRLRIRNTTTSAVVRISSNRRTNSPNFTMEAEMEVSAVVDVAAATETFVVEYYTTQAGTLGYAASVGDVEMQGTVEILDLETTPGPPGPQGPPGAPGAGGGGSGANLSYTASPTNGLVVSDTGTDATLTLATGTNAGLMAPADFTKLAGVETGATADMSGAEIVTAIDTQLGSSAWQGGGGGGSGANLSYVASPTNGLVNSDTGTDATIPLVDGTNAGLMAPAQHTKLAGITGTNTGDQNLFGTIAVSGQSNVVADATADTLTLAAAGNIVITTNAATDTITIGTSGTGGDVVGPSASVDYAMPVYSGTTGKLLRAGGPVVITPRMLGATGSGDETTIIQNFFSALAANPGAEGRIDRPYTVSGEVNYTANNLRLVFDKDAEFIITGAASLYGFIDIGTYPTGLTGRSLTANAARHAMALTFNNVASMNVGDILRLDWTGPSGVNQAFCALIKTKVSNTIGLSHPLPWALTTATTFTSVTCGPANTGIRIENFKARNSGHTGINLTALRLVNCEGARIYGSQTQGMISGGMLPNGCVDCSLYDHIGIDDGDTASDAAFPVYGFTGGLIDNVSIRGSDYFGFQLDYIHHSTCRRISGAQLGLTGGYVRGLKIWDSTNTVFDDVSIFDVCGMGFSVQNNCKDLSFNKIRVGAVRAGVVLGSPFPAQGINTNGTNNQNLRWNDVWCVGTDTSVAGHSDFSIGASDSGQSIVNIEYGTISNNEPNTTSIIRRNGSILGPNAPANPNLVINGDFQINQRSFGGGSLALNAYGFDRWKATVAANITLSGYVATMTSGTIGQVIELGQWGLSSLASTTVTVSVEAPSADMTVALGSVSGTITAGSGRRFVTLTTGAGDTGNLTLSLAKATAGTVTFGRVKLELGAGATNWQPRGVVDEQVLCKRYYQRIGGIVTQDIQLRGYQTGGLYFQTALIWPVEMRANPTGSIVGTWGVVNCGQPFIDSLSPRSGRMSALVTATGDVYYYTQSSSTYIELSSEL